jgi:hypothetical protein
LGADQTVHALEHVAWLRGHAPRFIRCDNGPELVSAARTVPESLWERGCGLLARVWFTLLPANGSHRRVSLGPWPRSHTEYARSNRAGRMA